VTRGNIGAADGHEDERDKHIDRRSGDGDEKFLAGSFGDALEPRDAADRQQNNVWRSHPERARREDVAEFMQQDAQEQQHHEQEPVPGGLRSSGDVAHAENPGQEQKEGDMDAHRRAGDRSDIQGPRHSTSRDVPPLLPLAR
jgi:hypothetical protein